MRRTDLQDTSLWAHRMTFDRIEASLASDPAFGRSEKVTAMTDVAHVVEAFLARLDGLKISCVIGGSFANGA